MHGAHFLVDVVYILAAAVLAIVVFNRLRIAPVLGYLIVGAAVGPFGIAVVGDVANVTAIAELGVVFLLFTIGLELPLERLKVLGLKLYGLGVAQIAITGAVVSMIAVAAGLPIEAAIVVGATVSLSSTVFVVQLLLDRGELSTRLGRTAFAVLLIQDIAVGPFLVVVLVLGDSTIPLAEALLLAAGKAALALVAILVIGRTVLRPVFRIAADARNAEVFVGTTLLVVLSTAILTQAVGLSLALGGLLAGILLAETEYRHQVAADIQPFRGLLLGLFFMTVGMSVDLGLALDNLAAVSLLAVSIIAVKAAILGATALSFGFPRRIAFPLGALLAQGGEFAFVLFGIAMVQGVLSKEVGQLLIVAISITLLLSPLLATLGGAISRRIARGEETGDEASSGGGVDLEGHVIVAGYGRVGRTIGARLQSEKVSVVGVDLDPDRVRLARQRGENVYFGDATRPEVLDALNVAHARAVVVALPNPKASSQMVGLLHYLFPELRILARAHDDEHAERLTAAGAQVVIPELIATGDRLANAILDNSDGRV